MTRRSSKTSVSDVIGLPSLPGQVGRLTETPGVGTAQVLDLNNNYTGYSILSDLSIVSPFGITVGRLAPIERERRLAVLDEDSLRTGYFVNKRKVTCGGYSSE